VVVVVVMVVVVAFRWKRDWNMRETRWRER